MVSVEGGVVIWSGHISSVWHSTAMASNGTAVASNDLGHVGSSGIRNLSIVFIQDLVENM